MRALLSLMLLLVVLLGPAPLRASDAHLCAEALREVEAASRLPGGLLGAVALAESGRRAVGAEGAAPWPWTVNNAGDGRHFATKREAIAWIEDLRRAGRRNIDVGCMQVNLMHHPDAFADLEEALDPLANVRYGARFLSELRQDTASWEHAVARYHTAEPERGAAYRARVYAHWRGARHGEVEAASRPIVLGPRPGMTRERASAPSRVIQVGARAATPSRANGTPRVLGPARAAPGVIGVQPRRPTAPLLAPAPGRLKVLAAGLLAPTRAADSAVALRAVAAAKGGSGQAPP